MSMKIWGWGKYPVITSKTFAPRSEEGIRTPLGKGFNGIPRAFGRSYGDSSLAEENINTFGMGKILSFNEETGLLHCQAGFSLEDILEFAVPKGWFLPVTPGTKHVSLGGAIASDVHGKNHHVEGCFSEHVKELRLMLADGSVAPCSPSEHRELFLATCGGMGLTGVILDAKIQLKPIKSSMIQENIYKARNLDEILDFFETYESFTYSVAWIDCLSTGKKLGRSLLMIGEHAEEGGLDVHPDPKLVVPFEMPSFLLNRLSISAFNNLYYNKVLKKVTKHVVHYEPFFYPLDGIRNWNRMYGKNGFTQYQFVVPKKTGRESMRKILERIAKSKKGSFLAVLKAFGKGNENYLSFPMEGYTLALDFKLEKGLFPLLDELDEIVLEYGGRVYLTKDVRMSEQVFKASYPNWKKFMEIRKKFSADKAFNSLQSKRLGL